MPQSAKVPVKKILSNERSTRAISAMDAKKRLHYEAILARFQFQITLLGGPSSGKTSLLAKIINDYKVRRSLPQPQLHSQLILCLFLCALGDVIGANRRARLPEPSESALAKNG